MRGEGCSLSLRSRPSRILRNLNWLPAFLSPTIYTPVQSSKVPHSIMGRKLEAFLMRARPPSSSHTSVLRTAGVQEALTEPVLSGPSEGSGNTTNVEIRAQQGMSFVVLKAS